MTYVVTFLAHRSGVVHLHSLTHSRESRHTKTVEVFLDHGVPFDLKAENGSTCLDMTNNQGTIDLINSRMTTAMKQQQQDDEENGKVESGDVDSKTEL
jgi:hypothetical protein